MPLSTVSPDATHFKYMALGDSYTIGEAVNNSQRFPKQLRDSLTERGFVCDKDTLIARTGWTTRNLLSAIDAANPKPEFDLVTLLIGVNNQYQNRSLSEYEIEFETCLQEAIRLAKGDTSHVVVLSIPDYGYTPYGASLQAEISAEIDAFNAINRQITLNYGISYIDITPISREQNSQLVAVDGLHPSGEQYRRWVKAMLPVVLSRIEQ